MNIQDWFPLGLTGGSPCCLRDSQESSPTPQLESINSSALSFLYSLSIERGKKGPRYSACWLLLNPTKDLGCGAGPFPTGGLWQKGYQLADARAHILGSQARVRVRGLTSFLGHRYNSYPLSTRQPYNILKTIFGPTFNLLDCILKLLVFHSQFWGSETGLIYG